MSPLVSQFIRYRGLLKPLRKISLQETPRYVTTAPETARDDEFRVLDLKGASTKTTPVIRRRGAQTIRALPPREKSMAVDQDWTNVWPGPRTFHPASVPLPLRQGVNKLGASPAKYGNAELMKIPNFLHLTPPAIAKHCAAIKKYCTPWPQGLDTEEDMDRHFPMEVTSTDYCHSGPSIRDPLSRIVSVKVPLNKLKLDAHAKDKFLRLVGDRYDEKTGVLTIVADKCPLKQQNLDYALYLLTAVYHESWTVEEWEKEKSDEDLEYYDWFNSQSKSNIEAALGCQLEENQIPDKVQNYRQAVISLMDNGETLDAWKSYGEASRSILFNE